MNSHTGIFFSLALSLGSSYNTLYKKIKIRFSYALHPLVKASVVNDIELIKNSLAIILDKCFTI